MTDEQIDQDTTPESTTVGTDSLHADETASPQYGPQYGVGPFSIREVALVGIWVVAFIVSFFSVTTLRFDSVWTSGLLWILTIAVPTAAVFLIVLRRLSPDGIRRVGSLGIDQFASVAFTVSAVLWIQLVWETVAIVVDGGPWVRSWVMWVELVLMLAGVALTVFGPVIPPFEEDFQGRREVPAHRSARPIRPVVARPAPVARPATADDAVAPGAHAASAAFADAAESDTIAIDRSAGAFEPATADSDEPWTPASTRGTYEPVQGTGSQPAVSHQAFWALAPVERDVVDAQGATLFRIGPSAWALVIEDRGDSFVVRHEDGTVGYLHDVSGITRG
ncbi:hypothetical protein F6B43_04580 [Microbacterium rhizomatis]|uniref:Uncharacterized protein n=1 Tax=Microbacterium rhizomatis TaxID=1631477 RepID=A0A5J5J7Z5_9MICO|nr:hypothetical protein F6B43_04580 [Microbacterium rhizomatis]